VTIPNRLREFLQAAFNFQVLATQEVGMMVRSQMGRQESTMVIKPAKEQGRVSHKDRMQKQKKKLWLHIQGENVKEEHLHRKLGVWPGGYVVQCSLYRRRKSS
jgi:hypothetical protein